MNVMQWQDKSDKRTIFLSSRWKNGKNDIGPHDSKWKKTVWAEKEHAWLQSRGRS